MALSNAAKLMAGIMMITVPTIEFGGHFLLRVLSGAEPHLTAFQKSMFRAGHAHAGVLLILGMLAQIFVDEAKLSNGTAWAVRIGFALAPILVSGGFFGGGMGTEKPAGLIALVYAGALILALSVVTLGIGLIRGRS
jgi:hypothetical protein